MTDRNPAKDQEHKTKRPQDEEPQTPENREQDANRTEADGEDFNPGGRPRPRTEATGEDF